MPLLVKQRDKHLQLILKPEHIKSYRLFIAAWLNYTNKQKEKKELKTLLKDKADRALLQKTLNTWKRLKEIILLKEERKVMIKAKNELRTLHKFFNAWVRRRRLIQRNKFLEEVIDKLLKIKLILKSLYSWKAYIEYQQFMRNHVQGKVKTEPFINKQRIENTYKKDYVSLRTHYFNEVYSKINYIITGRLEKPLSDSYEPTLYLPFTSDTQYSHTKVEDMPCVKVPLKNEEELFLNQSEDYLNNESMINKLRTHTKQALESIRILSKYPPPYCNTKQPSDLLYKKRIGRYFTRWKIRFLLNLVVSDCDLIRSYKCACSFFKELKKCKKEQMQRQIEISKIAGMKLMHKTLIGWKSFMLSINEKNDFIIKVFIKQRYFGKWKAYIFMTADKLLKIIKANEHYNTKLKVFSFKSLKRGINHIEKARQFYKKKVMKNILTHLILYVKQKIREQSYAKVLNKLKTPNTNLISTCYYSWKTITKLNKAIQILKNLLLKSIHGKFLSWKNIIKNSRALKNEIVRLFKIRFVMRGWLRLTNENRIILSYQHRESKLMHNAFKSFKMLINKDYSIHKKVLISLLDNVMQSKK